MRTRYAVGVALGFMLAASVARADDAKVACVQASDKAQALRDEHKLTAAKEQLIACARDACPGPVRKQCGEWLALLEKETPTVVFAARQGGRDVRVSIDVDGKRLEGALEGVAVPLDPGPHAVRYTLPGQAPVEQTLVVREGEKGRLVTADLPDVTEAGPRAAPPTPPPTSPEPADARGFHVPVAGWILGGMTVAAATSFAVFGVMGKGELSDLRSGCGVTASCAQADVDSAHTKLLVADISLYTGIAALAGGVVVTILANRHAAPAPAAGRATPLSFSF